VLPFVNTSGNPEQTYFAEGLAEDLITDLSKVPGLLVIARNSSFAYKGRSIDVRLIASELPESQALADHASPDAPLATQITASQEPWGER